MKDNKIFQSRNLQEHKRGVHTDKNKLLAIKRRQKREDEGLAKTEFKIRKFKCQHCDDILKSADGLARHIDMFHNGGKSSCEICEDPTHRKQAHFHFSGEYACIGLGCEEQFEHKTQLDNHILSKHTCKHCHVMYDNANNLNMHIEKDTFVHCLEFYMQM